MVDDVYTVSLLHFDGADASTTFTDESGKTATAVGNAKLSTTQKKFGTASLVLDGTLDAVSFASSADFSPGTGAFTIDAWVYMTSTGSYSTLFDMRLSDVNTAADLSLLISWGTDRYIFTYGAGTFSNSALNQPPQNQWVHIALVGNGGANGSRTIKCYINGTLSHTLTADYNLTRNSFSIGNDVGYNTGNGVVGYIDEVRFSKGIQRWTTNFTPPTSAYAPAGNSSAFFQMF